MEPTEAIDIALGRLDEPLRLLALRLAGAARTRVFRARMTVSETQRLIELARTSEAIGPGWGAAFVPEVAAAEDRLEEVPGFGGPLLQTAMETLEGVLRKIRAALPAGSPAAEAGEGASC